LKKEYESVVLGAMKMWNFKKDTSSNENTEFVYTLSFPLRKKHKKYRPNVINDNNLALNHRG